MANPLREFVDELTGAFANTLSFDIDSDLDPEAQVNQAIADAGVVAGFVSCVQPFPAADLFVLAPLHAKLAIQIGRIKGFEVTPERAGQIVREVMGVAWLALTSQALIGIVGKALPIVRPILTYPLNYAATWAIGQVVSYYFDCLADGRKPTSAEMKRVFAEQLQVGRKRGKGLDPVGVGEQAVLLRARIVARDPDLLTSIRLDPRVHYVPRRHVQRPAPASAPPSGGRIKIVIPPKPKPKPKPKPEPEPGVDSSGAGEAPPTPLDEREAVLAGKVPADAAGVSESDPPSEAEPDPSEDSPPVVPGPDSAAARSFDSPGALPEPEPEPAASNETSSTQRTFVQGLERLAELYQRGALSEEEFKAAKGRLLD